MGGNRKLKLLLAMLVAGVLVAGSLMLASCSCSDQSGNTAGVSVPNVVSLKRNDAEKVIVAAGLKLGNTTGEASDTVPAGQVISQTPAALTMVQPGTAVDLVISKGKAEPKNVTVPDLTGKTKVEAEKALSDVGLVGVASNPEETDAVAPGLVFKQSVPAGTTAKEGDRVAFTVALATATVEVPNVTGMSQQDAKNALVNAKLGYDTTVAYDDTVAIDNVISQSIPAGTQVKAGTTVTVQVSLGKAPVENVTVPDVTTFSWSDAEYALTSAGLQARYTGDPAGIVTSQDIVGGTQVAPGTLVTVTLTSSPDKVEVPDLTGMSVTQAEDVTDSIGLSLDLAPGSGLHGTIVEQRPEAGVMVDRSSTITVVVDDSEFRG